MSKRAISERHGEPVKTLDDGTQVWATFVDDDGYYARYAQGPNDERPRLQFQWDDGTWHEADEK